MYSRLPVKGCYSIALSMVTIIRLHDHLSVLCFEYLHLEHQTLRTLPDSYLTDWWDDRHDRSPCFLPFMISASFKDLETCMEDPSTYQQQYNSQLHYRSPVSPGPPPRGPFLIKVSCLGVDLAADPSSFPLESVNVGCYWCARRYRSSFREQSVRLLLLLWCVNTPVARCGTKPNGGTAF